MPQGTKRKLGGITKALGKSRPPAGGRKNVPAPRKRSTGGGGGGPSAATAARRLTGKIHNRIEAEMAARLARNSGTLSTLARSVGGGVGIAPPGSRGVAPGGGGGRSAGGGGGGSATATAAAAAADGGGAAKGKRKGGGPKPEKLKFNAKKQKGKT